MEEKEKFSVYITLENEEGMLVSHKKYEIDQEYTALVYNNDKN